MKIENQLRAPDSNLIMLYGRQSNYILRLEPIQSSDFQIQNIQKRFTLPPPPSPTEEISAIQKRRREKFVSDNNSKCMRASEGCRWVNFQFSP
jgi:hypothetical protein